MPTGGSSTSRVGAARPAPLRFGPADLGDSWPDTSGRRWMRRSGRLRAPDFFFEPMSKFPGLPRPWGIEASYRQEFSWFSK
jgi:hypothetical protein